MKSTKLVQTVTGNETCKVAKIFWNSEWEEFQVVPYIKGKKISDAAYYTDDKEDAISTAEYMVK
ncbi:hypothetical protein D3C85_384920 [compost metagenome]